MADTLLRYVHDEKTRENDVLDIDEKSRFRTQRRKNIGVEREMRNKEIEEKKPQGRIELPTFRLLSECSTDWAIEASTTVLSE